MRKFLSFFVVVILAGKPLPSNKLLICWMFDRQFGNCLVLTAACLAGDNHPWIRTIAPQDTVLSALQRTIDKISQYAPISPALEVDIAILKRAKQAVAGVDITVPMPAVIKQGTTTTTMAAPPMTSHSSFNSAF